MSNRSSSNRSALKILPVFGLAAVAAVAGAGCSKREASMAQSASTPMEAPPPPPGVAMASAAPAPAKAAFDMDEKKKEDKATGGKDGEPQTWKRAGSAVHATEISVGDKEKIPLRGMQIKVDVDGPRARVVIDSYFENDRDRQYEGNFKLRLPNDATPYYFAFGETSFAREAPVARDPGTPVKAKYFTAAEERTMESSPEKIRAARQATFRSVKEARMVPKEKAALAYTETTRRAADPALLEWAGAGVFNARVFPLAPHTLHRVVLAYDMPLTQVSDDLEYRLELPQTGADVVVDFSSALAPDGAAGFTRDGSRSYAHFEHPEQKQLALHFKRPLPMTIVGDDPGVGKSFFVAAKPELPRRSSGSDSDNAVFVIDTSLSSNPDRFNVYEKLVTATLENNRATMKKFAVLFFDVAPRWYQNGFVDNTPENASALVAAMDKISLEGATDLGAALHEAASPAWLGGGNAHWDTFLLSDGSPTWGESDAHAIAHEFSAAHRGPLFAYNTGISGTDTQMLASVTRASGGAVFSITGDTEVASASTAHKSRAWLISAVRAKGSSDVVIAGRPMALFPGQSLQIAGRGAPDGAVEIDVEQGGEKHTISIPTNNVVKSSQAARAYGEIATGQLEDFAPATDQTSRAYAVHYRVTGKTCSLLMLESEADYARFGIKDEDETARVAAQPAVLAVAQADRQIGETLGDPKIAFLDWMDGLGARSGVSVNVPADVRAEIAKLPRDTFAVKPAPLEMHALGKDQVPSDLRESLSKPGSLEYDRVSREADDRRAKYGPGDALRALSSLVEQSPQDAVLARDIAFTAMSWKLDSHAYHLLRRVGAARPWEPQTYRAMGQAAADMGNADLAIGYYEAALAGRWDGRFGEFHKIAAVDYVHLLRRIDKGELKTQLPELAKRRLDAMNQEVGLNGADLVVMITWNTDNSDVDLHVTEPSGEECYYGHRETRTGGQLTQDVTQGYGPEMYVLKKAPGGTYSIRAHYFASQRNRATARTKVYAHVIESWGRPNEKVTENVVTLVEGKEDHDILMLKR
jgi:hypothetical protein